MTAPTQLDLFDHACMVDAITITATQPAITINNGGALGSGLYGAADTYTIDWNRLNDGNQSAISTTGRLALHGDDADIEINGESIVGMLRDIRDRLAILRVAEDMEAEWTELRELRARYEDKLAECREKSQIWKKLQQPG